MEGILNYERITEIDLSISLDVRLTREGKFRRQARAQFYVIIFFRFEGFHLIISDNYRNIEYGRMYTIKNDLRYIDGN